MNSRLNISLIAAVANNNVIGYNNALPWNQRADLIRFKELTLNHVIVAGRKTHESILTMNKGKPLAGRHTVVVTRREGYGAPGCIVVNDWQHVLDYAREGGEEVFIIGGEEIYKLALPEARRLYLTRIRAKPDGDAFFPKYNSEEWRSTFSKDHAADPKNQYPFTFEIWERKEQ